MGKHRPPSLVLLVQMANYASLPADITMEVAILYRETALVAYRAPGDIDPKEVNTGTDP